MMPLGAPSISKYGSLVRPDTQIVALRAHCARTARALRLRPPLSIPVCDDWVVLEHGGGGTVSVGGLGWPSNSSMARGGLVGEAFADVIARRLPSPSGCGEGGDKAHGEEGVVSAWDCVGCKLFPTSTSSSHFCKTHHNSSLSLNLRATHSSPSKHHMHPSQ